jgi:hypothetical protein
LPSSDFSEKGTPSWSPRHPPTSRKKKHSERGGALKEITLAVPELLTIRDDDGNFMFSAVFVRAFSSFSSIFLIFNHHFLAFHPLLSVLQIFELTMMACIR